MKTGEPFENAVRRAISCIATDLDLEAVVNDKRIYDGAATSWELDVTAYAKGSGDLVVFECRDRGRNTEKAEMGAFAYTLRDLGATGFIVSKKNSEKEPQK